MAPVALDLSASATVPPVSQQIVIGAHDDSTIPNRLTFTCAVTDSKGPRRFMEDAHSLVVPFAGVHGQGFFAIFDGHAGKHAAEWCGQNFSLCLLDSLRKYRSESIPDVLNLTFHEVDSALTKISEDSDGKMHSGCTAVTSFLRLEDQDGRQSFLPAELDPLASASELIEGSEEESGGEGPENTLASPPLSKRSSSPTVSSASSKASSRAFTPMTDTPVRRVLYCANAGDARGVLCRGGKAVRLTYDHKGTDKQEAKRIMDAGGFVMSGRVNGVLAVTRSLGDSAMKEFVVGAPYTTETELSDDDEFMILACDGLWDVVDDQGAVNLVRATVDPKKAADDLLAFAYRHYSTDNVTVLVVRFRDPPEGAVNRDPSNQSQ